MSEIVLGRTLRKLEVHLIEDNQFGATVSQATPWEDPPRLVFSNGEEWLATVDPMVDTRAIFAVSATDVNKQFSGNEVELWVGDVCRARGVVHRTEVLDG